MRKVIFLPRFVFMAIALLLLSGYEDISSACLTFQPLINTQKYTHTHTHTHKKAHINLHVCARTRTHTHTHTVA